MGLFDKKQEEKSGFNFELECQKLNTRIQEIEVEHESILLEKKIEHEREIYSYKELLHRKDGDNQILKVKNETLQGQLDIFKGTDVESANKEIKELEAKLANNSVDAVQVQLQKALNEVDILKTQLKHKDALVKNLSSMPDVKKMIDTVANLRVPALDEMKEIFNMVDQSGAKELAATMAQFDSKLSIISSNVEDLRFQRDRATYGGYSHR